MMVEASEGLRSVREDYGGLFVGAIMEGEIVNYALQYPD